MVPHLTIERLFSGGPFTPFCFGVRWMIDSAVTQEWYGWDTIRSRAFFDMEFLLAGRFDSVQIGQTGRRLSAGLSESLDGVYLAVGCFRFASRFFARSRNLAAVSRIVI
jgi:hypothetical protein